MEESGQSRKCFVTHKLHKTSVYISIREQINQQIPFLFFYLALEKKKQLSFSLIRLSNEYKIRLKIEK